MNLSVRSRRLCPLIMAGDPDIEITRQLLQACVSLGVGAVELCVPFKDAFTDGLALQRAHERALRGGTDLEEVLALVREFADKISIILLADTSHTLRPRGFAAVCHAARDAGAAAMLAHGLPPRLAGDLTLAASGVIPLVGTVYATTAAETRKHVIARSSAFIYLVSTYGRSGGGQVSDLSNEIELLRSESGLPIAVGFGLKTAQDVASAFRMGSDIAIVGSAVTERIEYGLSQGDPVGRAREFIASLNAETRT